MASSTSRITQRLTLLSLRSSVYSSGNGSARIDAASFGRISMVTQRVASSPHRSRMYASHAPASASAVRIGNLQPAQATKNRKRLGRGPGSGRGGTATRGHKGQKARRGNGKPVPGFEGGQTPLHRRYPKRGFTNIHAKDYVPLNVDRLQHWVDRGLLDASRPITAKELFESRCIHNLRDGVKLLGDGAKHLRQPLSLIVSRASASAIKAVEAVGGEIVCRYYNRLTLRALVKPHKFDGRLLPRPADPINKKDILYYSSREHRGYLAKRAGERVDLVAASTRKTSAAVSTSTLAATAE